MNTLVDEAIVLSENHQGDISNYQIVFPENYRYFNGHFPNYKLLPAVVQMDWVINQLNKKHSEHLYLISIKRFKLKSPIFPETKVNLTLNFNKESGALSFSYSNAETNTNYSTAKVTLGVK